MSKVIAMIGALLISASVMAAGSGNGGCGGDKVFDRAMQASQEALAKR